MHVALHFYNGVLVGINFFFNLIFKKFLNYNLKKFENGNWFFLLFQIEGRKKEKKDFFFFKPLFSKPPPPPPKKSVENT